MKPSESLNCFRPGWWALMVFSVGAAFAAGFITSRHLAGHEESDHGASADHASGSDHHAESEDTHEVDKTHAAHQSDSEHAHAAATPPADHHAANEHDHTAPEVLRPLMQQMLVESVGFQGALHAGDAARAALHADAIAGACKDEGAPVHLALPERLGPKFLELDRALHATATRLGGALRENRIDDARALGKEMVSACQSCHSQAPAAKAVDLSVLASFAETLGSGGAK